jgi:hypothetical protein
MGQRIDPAVIPDPLEITLLKINPQASDHGDYLPEVFVDDTLILRDDVVASMVDEGANNLQLFDAVLVAPEKKKPIKGYKAVCVLGLIAAADLKKSSFSSASGGLRIDVDFDKLVIDPSRAHGELIFRLAESNNVILVHDRLRKRLEKDGFDKLWFEDPEKVAT